MECVPLQTLIENAYQLFADGVSMSQQTVDIIGGPSWVTLDRYDVSAKAENDAPFAQMAGPMMRTLLEERFKLMLHRESKEAPVYFLTVARGGPKMEPNKEGTCVTIDLDHPLIPTPGQPRPKICGSQGMSLKDGLLTINGLGITMESLASDAQLARVVGRQIVDKTGLKGRFDIHLEFAPEVPTPTTPTDATVPVRRSVFEAVQELGLKLEPGKGQIGFLMIDHVERPSEN